MKEELPPKIRGMMRREFFEIIVAEGKGIEGDPVREVHYFLNEDGDLIFTQDPSKKKR